jgi:hypothetical protein
MKLSATCPKRQTSLLAIGKAFCNLFPVIVAPFAFAYAILFMVTIYFQFFYKLLSACFVIVHASNVQKQKAPVTGRQLRPVVRLSMG